MSTNFKLKDKQEDFIWAHQRDLWKTEKRGHEQQLKCIKADWDHKKLMHWWEWFDKEKTRGRCVEEKDK